MIKKGDYLCLITFPKEMKYVDPFGIYRVTDETKDEIKLTLNYERFSFYLKKKVLGMCNFINLNAVSGDK